MSNVPISTAMSDEELRLARIHDAVNRSGLDPTTTLDLVCGLVEDEFSQDELDEEAPFRFRKMIEEGADVSLSRLLAVILDPDNFPHRHEVDYAKRLALMRKRVGQLTAGVAWRSAGGDRRSVDFKHNNIIPEKDDAPVGTSRAQALRKLRKSAPELHAAVLAGDLTAHGAMVKAGFRLRTMTVRPEPAAAARTLRKHLTPEQCAELARLLTAEVAA
jgi:hypothetical protein